MSLRLLTFCTVATAYEEESSVCVFVCVGVYVYVCVCDNLMCLLFTPNLPYVVPDYGEEELCFACA